MRFNQSQKLRIASSIKATLPGEWFSEPIVFTIRWIGNADYQRFLEENRQDSKFTDQLQELTFKAQAEAAAKAGKRRGKERKQFIEEYAQNAFSELLRQADLAGEFEGISDEGVVCHLVAHVDGLRDADTGEPISWSKAVGLELLSLPEPIPEEVVIPDEYGDDDFELDAGTQLGLAIKLWILWVAGQAQQFREAELEGAEKN